MEEKTNIVRVTNVTKTFKLGKIEVEALKGVDLEITKGNYLSIMGPSGSGKSTLFNMGTLRFRQKHAF
jgi:putative ABC transport system ATP-binding protein